MVMVIVVETVILLKYRATAGIVKLTKDIYLLSNGEELTIEEIKQRVKEQYKDTRVILSQAMLYFSAYFIILIGGYFYNTRNLYNERVFDIFMSLGEGFYQLLISIFHQVFNQRRHDPNVSIFDAISKIFRGETINETFILTRMHMVKIIQHEYEEDNYDGDHARVENESRPLLSSSGASANFGSASPLPTRSLISILWITDDNSNIQQSTSENGNEIYISSPTSLQYQV